jgi:hypothetical protein
MHQSHRSFPRSLKAVSLLVISEAKGNPELTQKRVFHKNSSKVQNNPDLTLLGVSGCALEITKVGGRDLYDSKEKKWGARNVPSQVWIYGFWRVLSS